MFKKVMKVIFRESVFVSDEVFDKDLATMA